MDTQKKSKRSRQRETVRKILDENRVHPSAAQVFDAARKEIPDISLGTVYRNLGCLEQDGTILRLDVGDGTDRFDIETKPHYHFHCTECGRVFDVELPYDENINRMAQQSAGGVVLRHDTVFHGICEVCEKKK